MPLPHAQTMLSLILIIVAAMSIPWATARDVCTFDVTGTKHHVKEENQLCMGKDPQNQWSST